jgi:hypothetical protein
MRNQSEIASALSEIELALDELIFEQVQEQLSGGTSESAKEAERRLARARRSIQKAIVALSGDNSPDLGN